MFLPGETKKQIPPRQRDVNRETARVLVTFSKVGAFSRKKKLTSGRTEQ